MSLTGIADTITGSVPAIVAAGVTDRIARRALSNGKRRTATRRKPVKKVAPVKRKAIKPKRKVVSRRRR